MRDRERKRTSDCARMAVVYLLARELDRAAKETIQMIPIMGFIKPDSTLHNLMSTIHRASRHCHNVHDSDDSLVTLPDLTSLAKFRTLGADPPYSTSLTVHTCELGNPWGIADKRLTSQRSGNNVRNNSSQNSHQCRIIMGSFEEERRPTWYVCKCGVDANPEDQSCDSRD